VVKAKTRFKGNVEEEEADTNGFYLRATLRPEDAGSSPILLITVTHYDDREKTRT